MEAAEGTETTEAIVQAIIKRKLLDRESVRIFCQVSIGYKAASIATLLHVSIAASIATLLHVGIAASIVTLLHVSIAASIATLLHCYMFNC